MTDETTESGDLVAALIDATAATETLMADVLAMIAESQPERIGQMRDQAATELQRHCDGRATPGDIGWPGLWAKRLEALEAAMSAVGDPRPSAQVVSLADARRALRGAADHAKTVGL